MVERTIGGAKHGMAVAWGARSKGRLQTIFPDLWWPQAPNVTAGWRCYAKSHFIKHLVLARCMA